MNNITIFREKEQMVVTSREVANNFGKQHKHVMEAIREIETSVENSTYLFIKSSYKDSYEREQNEYLLTRDGFSLLVMGFTGQAALKWKLKYIEAFKIMEQKLSTPQKLSAMETLKLQYEVLDEHDERISYLEGNMTIDFGQQRIMQDKAKSVAVKILGGMNSHAYLNRSVRSRVFSSVWKDFKDYFMLGSYRDTLRKEFDKAIEYLDNSNVQGKLLREIENLNNQTTM